MRLYGRLSPYAASALKRASITSFSSRPPRSSPMLPWCGAASALRLRLPLRQRPALKHGSGPAPKVTKHFPSSPILNLLSLHQRSWSSGVTRMEACCCSATTSCCCTSTVSGDNPNASLNARPLYALHSLCNEHRPGLGLTPAPYPVVGPATLPDARGPRSTPTASPLPPRPDRGPPRAPAVVRPAPGCAAVLRHVHPRRWRPSAPPGRLRHSVRYPSAVGGSSPRRDGATEGCAPACPEPGPRGPTGATP